jgi:hypothetical protein
VLLWPTAVRSLAQGMLGAICAETRNGQACNCLTPGVARLGRRREWPILRSTIPGIRIPAFKPRNTRNTRNRSGAEKRIRLSSPSPPLIRTQGTEDVFIFWVISVCSIGLAEEAYFVLPVTSMKFTDGDLPAPGAPNYRQWTLTPALKPYLVADGDTEGYIARENGELWMFSNQLDPQTRVLFRTSKPGAITGRLFIPKSSEQPGTILRFEIDRNAAAPVSREEFFRAKQQCYRQLRERDIPGTAWFRHQETAAAQLAGTNAAAVRPVPPVFRGRGLAILDGDLDSSFELFSGGRAVSENLQLNRNMPIVGGSDETVEVASLPGITVREMDWKALNGGRSTELDPQAQYVPYDRVPWREASRSIRAASSPASMGRCNS